MATRFNQNDPEPRHPSLPAHTTASLHRSLLGIFNLFFIISRIRISLVYLVESPTYCVPVVTSAWVVAQKQRFEAEGFERLPMGAQRDWLERGGIRF